MAEDQDQVIHSFEKNATEEVRMGLSEFKGHKLLYIRVFAENDEGEYIPTKKGITVNRACLPALAEGIRKLQEAV